MGKHTARKKQLATGSILAIGAALAATAAGAQTAPSRPPVASPRAKPVPVPPAEPGRITTNTPSGEPAVVSSSNDADRIPTTVPTPGDTATGSADEEDITVIGTRASLEAAIDRKKNAGTVVDSLVAEDVASFPDKNIGEALSRITGVQLTRDFGEGTQVSIRGVEPDLNRVEINGTTTLGQGGAGQRGADFRELASELVKSIDVFKGFTADMTEGGVGGTVSIQTRRPLDLRAPFAVVTASAQYQDTSDTIRPRGNVTFGGKSILGSRLGFIANFTYDDNVTRSDFLRNTEWVRFADLNNDNRKITQNSNFGAITTLAGCSAVPVTAATGATRLDCQNQFYEFVPRIPRYATWLRQDKRFSGIGTLQYEVTDRLDVYAEYQRNERRNHYVDYNWGIDVTALTRINTSGNCASCVIDADGNLIEFSTAATAPNATTGAGSIYSTGKRDFQLEQKSDYRTLGFNWIGDRFQLRGFGVRSKGTTRSENKSIGINATIPNIRVALDPVTGAPTLTFPTGRDPNNIATFLTPGTPILSGNPVVANFTYRPEEVDVGEDQAKIDADWDIDHPLLRTLEFGGQYRKSDSVRFTGGTNFFNAAGQFVPTPYITSNVQLGPTNTELAFPTSATNPAQGTAQFFTLAKYTQLLQSATEFTPPPFFNRGGFGNQQFNALSPNFNNLGNFFDTQYLNLDRVREVNGIAQTPSHETTEKIFAGYLKGNFAFRIADMRVTGNYGARYIRTQVDNVGFNRRNITTLNAAGQTVTSTVSIDTLTQSSRYNDILPSFNIAIEPVPNFFGRFGFAKVLARPRPTDLAPNINCTFDQRPDFVSDAINDSCTAGNPNLKPYRADQYDFNVAWYPQRGMMFSAAFFYKDIKTYVLAGQREFNVNVFGDGVLFDVTRPINVTGAKVRGIELQAQSAFTFLPAPFDGFGAQANATISRAANVGLFNQLTREELSFPFLSPLTYSLIGYYDKGFLNTRVAYTYRDSYLQTVAERSGNPAFRDATGYLDAKITLRFLDNTLQFFLEGKNLTGEVERVTSGSIRLGEVSYPGKRFFAGITKRF